MTVVTFEKQLEIVNEPHHDEPDNRTKYFALCSSPVARVSRDQVGKQAIWDFDLDMWFFKTKDEADIILGRLKQNERKKEQFSVRQLPSKIVDVYLYGSAQQKKIVKLKCKS